MFASVQMPSASREAFGFKIDRNLPIPERRGHSGTQSPMTQAVASLEVGESIFLGPLTKKEHNTASATVHGRRKKDGRSFTLRKTEDGYRVWRTE